MATDEENDHENLTNIQVHENVAVLYAKNKSLMRNMVLLAGLSCIEDYLGSYINKVPCRTSALSGWDWAVELLTGHEDQSHQNLHMNRKVFLKFYGELVNKYELKAPSDGRGLRVEESVAMFLHTIGLGLSNRAIQERFQHSGETVSRHFHAILTSMKNMAANIIKPTQDQNSIHPYVATNRRYRAFKDCIGALDGTHMVVSPKSDEAIPYFSRKGCYTQNVLAVCDFNMYFTFVFSGWEGSMHDSRIFNIIVNDPTKKFPYPCGEKYYLVDVGYAKRKGFLAPYKSKKERYHFQAFRGGAPPENENELFNHVHSSLRSVIERTFGVWKNSFAILKAMPSYDIHDQAAIVGGSMAIHIFIRQNTKRDEDEEFVDVQNDKDFVLERLPNESGVAQSTLEDPNMNKET